MHLNKVITEKEIITISKNTKMVLNFKDYGKTKGNLGLEMLKVQRKRKIKFGNNQWN